MMEWNFTVRVYFEDTDFSGVVYHANFLRFFERGRTEALRAAGFSHTDLAAGPVPLAFAVRSLQIEFERPARMDDLLVVTTRLSEVHGARLIFEQTIHRDGTSIASATVTVACMDHQGRPRRIPDAVRRTFSQTH